MFVSAAFALIAFVGYFAVASHLVRFTPSSLRFASLTLDVGLLCSAAGVISAVIAARQHRTQVGVCAAIGIFLILLSAFAVYATRAI